MRNLIQSQIDVVNMYLQEALDCATSMDASDTVSAIEFAGKAFDQLCLIAKDLGLVDLQFVHVRASEISNLVGYVQAHWMFFANTIDGGMILYKNKGNNNES